MAQDLTATLEGRTKGEIFTSFDVDAFEVPHGRDEIWRFTPLRRLRGLHDASAHATGSAHIDVTERPGVTTAWHLEGIDIEGGKQLALVLDDPFDRFGQIGLRH